MHDLTYDIIISCSLSCDNGKMSVHYEIVIEEKR